MSYRFLAWVCFTLALGALLTFRLDNIPIFIIALVYGLVMWSRDER